MAIYRVERTRDYYHRFGIGVLLLCCARWYWFSLSSASVLRTWQSLSVHLTVMSNYHLKDRELSLKAKGLLSMILSLPDEWNYTLRGLAAISKEGVDAIGSTVRELEKAGYIIRRQLRGANGRISDTEYTIYEQPHKQDNPSDVEVANLNEPYTGNPDMDRPSAKKPAELNTNAENIQRENTNRVNIDVSNTHSFSHSIENEKAAERMDGKTEIKNLRDKIKEQVGYEYIANAGNRQQLDELVELMLEVALTKSPVIKLGRDMEYPTAYVQERFAKIGQMHIEKVLAGIAENTTQVKNTKAYLLAALFNAPSTLDNHYVMQVNHDIAADVR